MEFIWLSQLNMTEREWREIALSMAKNGVTKSATRLSKLLADFIYVVSDGDEAEITAMFRSLRDALELKIDLIQPATQLVVFDRFFALLEAGEEAMSERSKPKKLKQKAQGGPVHVITVKEAFVCTLVGSFCRLVAELQALLSALLEQPVSVGTARACIGRCEEGMNAIESDIYYYSLNVSSAGKGRGNSSRAEHVFLRRKMVFKVGQLWVGRELDEV